MYWVNPITINSKQTNHNNLLNSNTLTQTHMYMYTHTCTHTTQTGTCTHIYVHKLTDNTSWVYVLTNTKFRILIFLYINDE